MIIRIMGLGQWSMEPDQLLALNGIDETVEEAVEAGDQEALGVALAKLVAGCLDDTVIRVADCGHADS